MLQLRRYTGLRANIDWKSVFLKGVGQFQPNFHVLIGDVPANHFFSECLTTLSLTLFTQRNFVADFLQVKSVTENSRSVFFSPRLGVRVRGNVCSSS